MGLKREHREAVEMLRKEHDEELFKIRGEQALPVQYHVEKIQQVRKFKINFSFLFCGLSLFIAERIKMKMNV
jgi:hypothetical protein